MIRFASQESLSNKEALYLLALLKSKSEIESKDSKEGKSPKERTEETQRISSVFGQ
jgi:hypothetical protein